MGSCTDPAIFTEFAENTNLICLQDAAFGIISAALSSPVFVARHV